MKIIEETKEEKKERIKEDIKDFIIAIFSLCFVFIGHYAVFIFLPEQIGILTEYDLDKIHNMRGIFHLIFFWCWLSIFFLGYFIMTSIMGKMVKDKIFWKLVRIYCILISYLIIFLLAHDLIRIKEISMEVLQFMANNLLEILSLLSLCFVGLSNGIRYMYAKRYYLQFRLTYHSIYESIDIFVTALILLGLGVGLPLAATITTNDDITFFIILLGLLSSTSWIFLLTKERKEIFYEKENGNYVPSKTIEEKNNKKMYGYFKFGVAGVALVAGIAFIFIANTGGLENASIILIGIIYFHIMLMILATGFHVFSKLNGESGIISRKDHLTTTLDDKKYVIVTRYSKDEWILMHCEIDTDALFFYKNEFIIKNIKDMDIEVIHTKNIKPMVRLK